MENGYGFLKIAEIHHNLPDKDKGAYIEAFVLMKDVMKDYLAQHPELHELTKDPEKMNLFRLGVVAGLDLSNRITKNDIKKIEAEIVDSEREVATLKQKLEEMKAEHDRANDPDICPSDVSPV
jgi:hypothetical protein